MAGSPDTRGVDHVQRKTVQLDVLANDVPSGPRNIGDDGGVAAGEQVHEAGFAHVGLAGEDHAHTLLQ